MQKIKSIILILGVLTMSLSLVYLVLAWTEPSSSPPGSNVSAPLNTSINAQSKEGALIIGTNSALTTGLIVRYGNVGIGTLSPGAKLEVNGQVKITGGSPGVGKVLTSIDNAGLAIWQTLAPAPAGGGATPTGGIIMYSGAWNFDGTGLGTGTLAGWALCNGNNGTPNLSNRFVMGTIASGSVGSTGGTNFYTLTPANLPAHTHAFTTASAGSHTHSLTINSAGSHTHSGSTASAGTHAHTMSLNASGSHTHSGSTNTTGAHTHPYLGMWGSASAFGTLSGYLYQYQTRYTSPAGNHSHSMSLNYGGYHTHSGSSSSAGAHAHTMSLNASGSHTHSGSTASAGAHAHSGTTASTGSGVSFDNRPAFIQLAFIKKL